MISLSNQPQQNAATSIWHALKVQIRVVNALVLREVATRYGKKNIGFLWLIIEPVIVIGALIGFRVFRGGGGSFGLDPFTFILTGYCPVLLWRYLVTRGSGSLQSNSGLMYHRNVRVIDVFLARSILEFFGATFAFLFLLFLGIYFGFAEMPHSPARMVLAWFFITWLGLGCGMIAGCISNRVPAFQRMLVMLTLPVKFASGIFFMLAWLPQSYHPLLLLNPLLHVTEFFRESYYGANRVTAIYDLSYVIMFALAITFIGLLLSQNSRNLERN